MVPTYQAHNLISLPILWWASFVVFLATFIVMLFLANNLLWDLILGAIQLVALFAALASISWTSVYTYTGPIQRQPHPGTGG